MACPSSGAGHPLRKPGEPGVVVDGDRAAKASRQLLRRWNLVPSREIWRRVHHTGRSVEGTRDADGQTIDRGGARSMRRTRRHRVEDGRRAVSRRRVSNHGHSVRRRAGCDRGTEMGATEVDPDKSPVHVYTVALCQWPGDAMRSASGGPQLPAG